MKAMQDCSLTCSADPACSHWTWKTDKLTCSTKNSFKGFVVSYILPSKIPNLISSILPSLIPIICPILIPSILPSLIPSRLLNLRPFAILIQPDTAKASKIQRVSLKKDRAVASGAARRVVRLRLLSAEGCVGLRSSLTRRNALARRS